MSKATLILNKPENCEYCNFMYGNEYSYWCLYIVEKNARDIHEHIVNNTKPDWCPLKKSKSSFGM